MEESHYLNVIPWTDNSNILDLFGDYEPALDLPELSFSELLFDFPSQLDQADVPLGVSSDNLFSSDDKLSSPPNSVLPGPQYDHAQSSHSTASSEIHKTPEESQQEVIGRTDSEERGCENANKSKKRQWEDSVTVFPSNENTKPERRRRKPFAPSRKKEVALNRMLGACIECKILKSSCNSGIPCKQCIKRVCCPNLAQWLCTRRSLKATRFDNIDLFRITKMESRLLYYSISDIRGPIKDAYITYPGSSVYVKVQVQDLEELRGTEPMIDGILQPWHPVQMLISYDYDWYAVSEIPNNARAFAKESLPTLENLLRCFPPASYGGTSGPFAGLHRAFINFAEIYCNRDSELPLHELMGQTLRMKLLLSIFRQGVLIKETPDSLESSHLPQAMSLPLKLVTAKAIVELELEILSELDKLLYGPKGLGRRNPLATWISLWILILSYKEHMQYVSVVYHTELLVKQTLYGLAQHIYNTLTAIYAALYKTTSPLIFDWRKDEVAEMLGRDPKLITALCSIKTEMYWFHAGRDLLFAEDALLKTLVVDNESKLLASHIKSARRQGLLP